MTSGSRDGIGCALVPFIGSHSLFASEQPNELLEPTGVGRPPLAAQLQR